MYPAEASPLPVKHQRACRGREHSQGQCSNTYPRRGAKARAFRGASVITRNEAYEPPDGGEGK